MTAKLKSAEEILKKLLHDKFMDMYTNDIIKYNKVDKFDFDLKFNDWLINNNYAYEQKTIGVVTDNVINFHNSYPPYNDRHDIYLKISKYEDIISYTIDDLFFLDDWEEIEDLDKLFDCLALALRPNSKAVDMLKYYNDIYQNKLNKK